MILNNIVERLLGLFLLVSEEYRESFDNHLLAPPVVQLISAVISGVTSLATE